MIYFSHTNKNQVDSAKIKQKTVNKFHRVSSTIIHIPKMANYERNFICTHVSGQREDSKKTLQFSTPFANITEIICRMKNARRPLNIQCSFLREFSAWPP